MKNQTDKCPRCSGDGKREYDHQTPRGDVIQIEAVCDGCEGSGRLKDYKPEICPKHPDGLIAHSCDLTEGVKSNHRYACYDCGRELAGLNRTGRIADEITRMAYEAVRHRQNKVNGW